jgi:hypothetical protein
MAKRFIIKSQDKFNCSDAGSTGEEEIKILLDLISGLATSIKEKKSIINASDQISSSLGYFKSMKRDNYISQTLIDNIETILKKLNCDMCENSISTYQVDCGHCLCDDCLEAFSEAADPRHPLKCPKCSEDILPISISPEFAKTWYEKLSKFKSICIGCKKESFQKLGCEHYCPECLCEKFRKGQKRCNECNSAIDIPEEIYNIQEYCKGCNSSVYLYGDYVKTICNDHPHCFLCLKKALETKLCQTCEIFLPDYQEKVIAEFLYSECTVCRNNYEQIYFVPKECCDKLVCGVCQAPNTNCTQCGGLLEEKALDFVQKFSVAQRLLDNRIE